MTNQFIAHADTIKTFAHKKGARAAIKRDLGKHEDTHGDVLFATGFDVRETGDRFGVVIYVDLTADEAQSKIGPELEGYVIEPQLKEAPKVAEPKDDTPVEATDDKPKRKRNAQIEIAPSGQSIIPTRHGSKQQIIIDLLARDEGASLDELVAACVRKDGTNWDPASLMAGLYHHIPHKGYGVRTTFDANNVARYHLVYPDGMTAPVEPRRPQAQQNLVNKIRACLNEADTKRAKDIAELTDDQLLEKFRNVSAVKDYIAEVDEAA